MKCGEAQKRINSRKSSEAGIKVHKSLEMSKIRCKSPYPEEEAHKRYERLIIRCNLS